MTAISVSDLVVRHNNRPFLDNLSFSIDAGERVALVGRNGAGKSTLLRILAGIDQPDEGDVSHGRGLKVGFLSQEFALDPKRTIRANVLDGAAAVTRMLDEYHAADPASARAAALAAELEQSDAWNLDTWAETVMDALKVPDPNRYPESLSGGERRRAALCRVLIGSPGLLLLDEPTNHLDIETIEWLENYFQRYRGSLVLVTHDRYFLDRVTTRILELDNGLIYSYDGNYSQFLLRKAEREEAARAHEEKRQSFIRRELNWVRRGPKARGTKAKGRLDRFWDAVNQEAPAEENELDLMIPPAPQLANRIIDFEQVGLAYGTEFLFRGLSFELEAGWRVGVLGPNGCGKTSFLRLLIGELAPTEGEIRLGTLTRFNYVDQNRAALNLDNSLFEEIGEGNDFVEVDGRKVNVWSYLKRFLFAREQVRMPVRELSGGEKNRLLLAKQLKNGGNVLLLDEPTNDLDLASLRVLEETLAGFGGCLFLVSHDRYVLNRVCTHMLVFDGRGDVELYEGNYDYYLEKYAGQSKPVDEKPSATATGTERNEITAPRRLTWKEKEELKGMEARIMAAEGRVAELESIFSSPDFFEKHGEQTTGLEGELKRLRAEVQALYERWDELETVRLMTES